MADRLTTQLLGHLQDLKDVNHVLTLDGQSLTSPQVLAAAEDPSIQVKLADSVPELLEKNHNFLASKVAEGKKIYGVNTGYGGSADVRFDDVKEVQRALIHHLNAGFGEKIEQKIVRGVMVVRANSLSKGFSGVRPDVVDCLCRMINDDIIPVVPKRGSISASGDLMPTSYIACCMMGRPDAKVIHKGVARTMKDLMEEGFQPIQFMEKEALAVVNAASFGSTMAACLLNDSSAALLMTQISTALTVESLRGRLESFHPTIHECMPHTGQKEAAANISRILSNSKLAELRMDIDLEDHEGVLKQDRYALRTSAQWLSPAIETMCKALDTIKIDLNSANDNPLIDHIRMEILHGGNFQGVSATVAMDQTRQALQLCGKLLFAQMSEMLNVNMSHGLPPNLCGSNPNVDFGLKGTDTAMASYMSELDYLTAPMTNHVLSAEMHNQSINSLALISARMTSQALDVLHMMLANITLAHVQAIDLRVLQECVQGKISSIIKNHNLQAKFLTADSFKWYKFAFTPGETTSEYTQFIELNGVVMNQVKNEMEASMIPLVDDFVKGRYFDDVMEHLGEGTKNVYSFIRKDLNVPFCDGRRPIDNMLETIHSAIKDRRINKVLLETYHPF